MPIVINNWWETKRKEVKKTIKEKFQHTSPMQTTDIEKIVLNSGVSQAVSNKELLENTEKALIQISHGQKPILTHARKSITGFKLREGMPIGCKVTLRKKRAWDFLFELINLNLPLTTNFRGLSNKKFDEKGNYNLGINDLNIFPAVPYNLIFKNQGVQITIVFKSSSTEENSYFLGLLGFPFKEKTKMINIEYYENIKKVLAEVLDLPTASIIIEIPREKLEDEAFMVNWEENLKKELEKNNHYLICKHIEDRYENKYGIRDKYGVNREVFQNESKFFRITKLLYKKRRDKDGNKIETRPSERRRLLLSTGEQLVKFEFEFIRSEFGKKSLKYITVDEPIKVVLVG